MEEVAAKKQYECAFLGFPLKLRGATASADAFLRRPVARLSPVGPNVAVIGHRLDRDHYRVRDFLTRRRPSASRSMTHPSSEPAAEPATPSMTVALLLAATFLAESSTRRATSGSGTSSSRT